MKTNFKDVFHAAHESLYSDPHGAVVSFIREYLRDEPPSGFSRSSFHDLLCGKQNCAPGLGLEYGGGLIGFYDHEAIGGYGVSSFADGEAFVARYERAVYFDEVMYSRAETCGWLSLGITQFSRHCRVEQERLLSALSFACNPESVIKKLLEKIEGIEHWLHGPIGPKSDKVNIDKWRSTQGHDLKLRYLS